MPSQLVIVEHGDHSLRGDHAKPTPEEISDLIFKFLGANLK